MLRRVASCCVAQVLCVCFVVLWFGGDSVYCFSVFCQPFGMLDKLFGKPRGVWGREGALGWETAHWMKKQSFKEIPAAP